MLINPSEQSCTPKIAFIWNNSTWRISCLAILGRLIPFRVHHLLETFYTVLCSFFIHMLPISPQSFSQLLHRFLRKLLCLGTLQINFSTFYSKLRLDVYGFRHEPCLILFMHSFSAHAWTKMWQVRRRWCTLLVISLASPNVIPSLTCSSQKYHGVLEIISFPLASSFCPIPLASSSIPATATNARLISILYHLLQAEIPTFWGISLTFRYMTVCISPLTYPFGLLDSSCNILVLGRHIISTDHNNCHIVNDAKLYFIHNAKVSTIHLTYPMEFISK